MFIRNALLALTLTVVNLTRLTWTCILALLIESRKEISEDRSRRQLDHRERPAMSGRIVHVIVGIICFVDHDRVFLKASDALTAMKIYALICTSNFFRSMRTFATLVQTCIVRCGLFSCTTRFVLYSRFDSSIWVNFHWEKIRSPECMRAYHRHAKLISNLLQSRKMKLQGLTLCGPGLLHAVLLLGSRARSTNSWAT